MIFRALEAAGQMCYSGDMFDDWTYFGPVEMMEKDRYSKVCLCIIFVLLTPKNYLHINFYQIKLLECLYSICQKCQATLMIPMV